jgi:hypothetical protein
MEIHWWEVLVDIITIVLVAGKLLEPLWGAIEVNREHLSLCMLLPVYLNPGTWNHWLIVPPTGLPPLANEYFFMG